MCQNRKQGLLFLFSRLWARQSHLLNWKPRYRRLCTLPISIQFECWDCFFFIPLYLSPLLLLSVQHKLLASSVPSPTARLCWLPSPAQHSCTALSSWGCLQPQQKVPAVGISVREHQSLALPWAFLSHFPFPIQLLQPADVTGFKFVPAEPVHGALAADTSFLHRAAP